MSLCSAVSTDTWQTRGDILQIIATFAGRSTAAHIAAASLCFRRLPRKLFSPPEDITGVRMAWNVWPYAQTRADFLTSQGCSYTPFVSSCNVQRVVYEAVRCSCGAVLNPHCNINLELRTWSCPFCFALNIVPTTYIEPMSRSELPLEMLTSSATIEYVSPDIPSPLPCLLFVVDVATTEMHELAHQLHRLQQALTMLHGDTCVGLITFGGSCCVHDLKETCVPKICTLSGDRSYSSEEILQHLGGCEDTHFVLPLSECYHRMISIITDIEMTMETNHTGGRRLRCSGLSLSVAMSLLDFGCVRGGAKIVLLTSGPCTCGPGIVVGPSYHENMRSLADLQHGNHSARYIQMALSYYEHLAARAVASCYSVDIVTAALDQVGLHEMRVLSDRTGGAILMECSFADNAFNDTFRKLFEMDDIGYLRVGFNATMEILTSPELQCRGASGTFTTGSAISELACKRQLQTSWKSCAIGENVSFGFHFGLVDPHFQRNHGFIQFQTSYTHASGQRRLRVTTVRQSYADILSKEILNGFDYEVAAMLVARQAIIKAECEELTSVKTWIEEIALSYISVFGTWKESEIDSFQVGAGFASFIQMMYFLQHTGELFSTNCSPDDRAYSRVLFLRERTSHACQMIQPSLLFYSLDAYLVNPKTPPLRVRLEDCASMRGDGILVVDTYSRVLYIRSDRVQAWYDVGYQHQEEYSYLKDLMKATSEDAERMGHGRLILPRLLVGGYDSGSAVRILRSLCRNFDIPQKA